SVSIPTAVRSLVVEHEVVARLVGGAGGKLPHEATLLPPGAAVAAPHEEVFVAGALRPDEETALLIEGGEEEVDGPEVAAEQTVLQS
ncbi:hypothetical protein AVEN_171945-1, partial [Araneus ventricosus]